MLHGPLGRQLELLKSAEKHQMGLDVIGATHQGVIFGRPPISRTQQTLEKQLKACLSCVLDRHVRGTLRAEGVKRKNKRSMVRQVYPRISSNVCA